MSYNDDKRELLKLRQGIIQDEEATIKEEKPPEKYVLHGKKKVANFFYHYKLHVIVITFCALVAGFLIYQQVSGQPYDIKVIMVASNEAVEASIQYKYGKIKSELEKYTPDYDKNGSSYIETYFFDLSDSTFASDVKFANMEKFSAEISLGDTQLLIGDREMFESMCIERTPEEYYVNLSERYPDCENIVDNHYFKISGSEFEKKFNAEFPDNMYIVILAPYSGFKCGDEKAAANREKALEVLDNIINEKQVQTVTE